MENSGHYKIPLSEILAILKVSGYEVSVERILEIQSVLLSAPVSKSDLSELKFIITPVLARNKEDQKNIYRIIDSYISDKVRPAVNKATGVHVWLKNRMLIFGLKIAGFIIIVVTAVLLYFFQKNENKKNRSAYYPQQVLPSDPSSIDKTRIKDTAAQKLKSPGNTPRVSYSVEYNGKAIVPSRLSIILQISGAFGLGLGAILYYFIFYEKRKRMEAKKKAKEEGEGYRVSKEGENENVTEQLVHVGLQFPEKDFLIQKTKEFSIIRANLKKNALTGKLNLNVMKSVDATVKNAGFPSLAFDGQWKERKYLILADNKEHDAHINYLLEFLINFLSSSKISVLKYTYTTDIRVLSDKSRQTISLENLSYDFPGYHLIITGDCRSFFNNDSLFLKKELDSIFRKWAFKSIITPVPLPDWSYPEVQLQNSSFHVVPAEIGAVELLSKAIAEESPVKTAILANRIRDKYSVSKYHLKTANEIRDYLNNEELFQVICSLAVYPRLDWNITLALFSAILKKNSGTSSATRLNYDTLLKISRIPWLYTGQLDQSARLQLFNFLKPETEVIARETILDLLREINPFVSPGSPASRELQVQVKVNSFFLYAHDQQQYKEYADVKNEFLNYWNDLKEWSLKERVKNGLMPVNSKGEHTTVEEFVVQEEQFEKSKVTFLKIVLLTLPAAILYILFTIFRPPMVYLDSYEKVSFLAIIKKDSACKKELTQVVVSKLDKFDTITMKRYNDINYIEIDNVEFNRAVGLSLLFTDSSFSELPIEARDSVVVVSVKCP